MISSLNNFLINKETHNNNSNSLKNKIVNTLARPKIIFSIAALSAAGLYVCLSRWDRSIVPLNPEGSPIVNPEEAPILSAAEAPIVKKAPLPHSSTLVKKIFAVCREAITKNSPPGVCTRNTQSISPDEFKVIADRCLNRYTFNPKYTQALTEKSKSGKSIVVTVVPKDPEPGKDLCVHSMVALVDPVNQDIKCYHTKSANEIEDIPSHIGNGPSLHLDTKLSCSENLRVPGAPCKKNMMLWEKALEGYSACERKLLKP